MADEVLTNEGRTTALGLARYARDYYEAALAADDVIGRRFYSHRKRIIDINVVRNIGNRTSLNVYFFWTYFKIFTIYICLLRFKNYIAFRIT